ncbi:transporter [Ruegeria conchae]|uniref:SphA family protein n=1 Tax=Ruegeria conchae TaxID=981384 RepID=UPI0029C752B7|nr:transporter [Ruegeria conchae]
MSLVPSPRSVRPVTKGVIVGLLFAVACGSHSLADEGGVSFWLPGQYASFAAIPPEPGFSMPLVTYGYSGNASRDRPLSIGGEIRLGVDARYLGQFIIPTYSPQNDVLGGRLAFSLATIIATSKVSADATIGSNSGRTSERVTGFGDLYPTAQLFWNNGVNNWMAYATGAIPVGDYKAGRLTNIGIGHGAIDVGGAYTYFNPDTGWEASATLGLTYNFENPDTDYTNGESIHLDWAVSKFVSEKWQIGAVGFAYKQISDDDGAPEILEGFRGETYGIGPQVAYSGEVNGKPIYASLRAYHEFETQNRTEGTAVFLTLSFAF